MSNAAQVSTRRRPPRTVTGWPLLLAEITLVAVTLATVFSLSRLFETNDHFGPVALAALTAHTLAALLRRARLGAFVALFASAVGLAFFIANVRYGTTVTAGIPTSDTWSALGDDLSEAWDAFSVVKAPTDSLDGFVVALMAVVWIVATVADLAAFRVRTVVEALLPATVLFVFVALLGVEEDRVRTTAVFLVATIMFVLAARIAFPLSNAIPVGATRSRQPGAHLRVGIAMVAVTLVVGLVAGPLLPGVDAEPVIDWKALDGGGGSRVTLSPLVDARGRLVEQTDVELFRVTTSSGQGAYWRTTSLDTYTDGVWGSSYSYTDARGTLSRPDSSQGEILDLEVEVTNLGDIWIPAPYEPVTIQGVDAKWDPVSSTLVTPTGQFTDGISYEMRAIVPTYNPDRLRNASGFIPDDIRIRYTALPTNVSRRVTDLGRELTAGLDSNYDRALAIQTFFRSNFTYSTEVDTGHSGDRVERFLFDDRVGYCEQFAGTFALMARAAGLPTRVAVGFTPGQRVGDEFVVRGENYHAWPEVWIDGAWVQFEPTPGRGSPQGQAWTGVEPAQEGGFDSAGAEEDEIGDGGELALPELDIPDNFDLPEFETGDQAVGADAGDSGSGIASWILPTFAIIAGIAAVIGGWWYAVPWLVRRRRAKRRERAGDRRARVEALWLDLTDTLALAGHPPRPSETRTEYAARVGPLGVVDGAQLRRAASVIDTSAFGRDEPDALVEAHAAELVAELERDMLERTTSADRTRYRIDPRPIFTTR